MLRLGRWRLHSLVDGTFSVDGGSAFGIVPRALWARDLPPDGDNRIRLAARSLLAVDEASGRRVLVDAGFGDCLDAHFAAHHSVERPGGGLRAGLRALGVEAGDVTDLVLTHLHLEHAGGLVRPGAGGRPELAFPRAAVHVQRRAWQWAHAPSEHDRAAFRPALLEPLGHGSQLHLVDGELELFPGLELVVSEGHTVAQQLPRFRGEGESHLTCCGDLVPTAAHLRPAWGMAFDLLPLTAIEEKKVLLAEALEDDGILLFGHDPAIAACRLSERDGHPAFREAVEV
ncbi:MAG: MBL fold metallo-hydrolase [Deltaproteobacteria bacterium]|nr:MBL fold metallo-hydrolase [Deltaproteobacteria bacterium]